MDSGGPLAYLLCYQTLQDLPTLIHCSELLGEVSLVAAFTFHILSADLQHGLVHKINCQLFTVHVYLKALEREGRTQESKVTQVKALYVIGGRKALTNLKINIMISMI